MPRIRVTTTVRAVTPPGRMSTRHRLWRSIPMLTLMPSPTWTLMRRGCSPSRPMLRTTVRSQRAWTSVTQVSLISMTQTPSW